MIVVHIEVADALRNNQPVVALESAAITAGLPRTPISLSKRLSIEGWRADRPCNLELGRAMERTVRAAGAIPATIAVIDGQLRIGLDQAHLERLALDPRAGKASITDLAHALAHPNVSAGTTVSATLAACGAREVTGDRWQVAGDRNERSAVSDRRSEDHLSTRSGIRVFATGGIGGVHREWTRCPDISADLRMIAQTPVCVVCSGGKSILDVPATLEALETLGVPVLGFRTHLFPQFQMTSSTSLRVRLKVDDAKEAATICARHWATLRQRGGIVLANPVPEALAVDAIEMTLAVEAAERVAKKHGITGGGAQRTPFMLNEIARLTDNRSLEANLALLVSNAQLAAEVSRELVAVDHSLH